MTSGGSDAFGFTSEKVTERPRPREVASRPTAWCRSSFAIYKSIYRVSELVRILAGSVFDPGWWI